MKVNELDFSDLKTGVVCMEAKSKHEMLTLKLNSIFLGAEVLIEPIKELIENRSDFIKEEDEFINFNIDTHITRYMSSQDDNNNLKINSCLNDIISGKLNTNFSIKNEFIKNKKHNKEVSSNNISTLMNKFKSGSNHSVKVAEESINNIMELISGQEDMEVFIKLEQLEQYIRNTKFLGVYKNWKDMTECINENCSLISDSLEDDAFLYFDTKKKKFILPIDINNGTVRIKKFFENETITPIIRKKLNKLEERYNNYKQDKLNKLKMGEHKLKMAGAVSNPFTSIINNSKPSETINNLF